MWNSFFCSINLYFIISPCWASSSFGTAFSVGDGYTYVTNHHVVSDSKIVCLRNSFGDLHRAVVINSDQADDLVLLRSSLYSNPLRLGSYQDIIKGMTVLTIGYPFPDVMGFESKVTEGIVNSLSGIRGDSRRMQISAQIQPGNSGGPLLAQNGLVVGVVVSKLGERFAQATGQRADNIGFAINVARLRALIETTPEVARAIRLQPSLERIDRTRLVSQIEPSVALVAGRSKGERCNEEGDIQIPSFGANAKSRSELAREQSEARERHRARVEAEKSELQREAREAAQAVLERTKEREANEKREQEREAERGRLVAAAKSSLSAINQRWQEIEASPGFHYWTYYRFPNRRPQLYNLESGEAFPALLGEYINNISRSSGKSANKNPDEIFEFLISGELKRVGTLIFSDIASGYGIALLSGVNAADISELLVYDNKNARWIITRPERHKERQVSFLIDSQKVGSLLLNSDVFAKVRGSDR